MSSDVGRVAGPVTGDRSSGSWPGRLWRARLWAHALVLAVVLVAAAAATRPGAAFSSDEGAALLQARVLDQTGGWFYEYPLRALDREDQARPFVRGDLGDRGLAIYAKHPLYPLVLAGTDRAGVVGLLGANVLATVVAALLAARLAREVRPGIERTTLWVVGVASPLFIDSFLVLAHTLAAAATAAAAWAAVLALRLRGGRRVAAIVGVAIAVAVAAMLRTEALFIGPALALGVLAAAARARRSWGAAVATGTAAVVGAAGAFLIDRFASRAIIGTSIDNLREPSIDFLSGRVSALTITWFAPSYGDRTEVEAALWIGLLAVAVAAVALRLQPPRPAFAIGGLLVAVLAVVVRLTVGEPAGPIPGLFVAFPVLWMAVWSMRWPVVSTPVARLLGVTTVVAATVIMVLQYASGGGLEWGGRYFALLLPLAGPLAVASLAAALERVEPDRRSIHRVVGALVVLSVLVLGVGLRSLYLVHGATDRLFASVADAAASVPAGPGGRPVVLSDNRLLPQLGYPDFDRYDWVVPNRDDLARYGSRLAAAGTGAAVLVSTQPDQALAELPGWREVRRVTDPERAYQVWVVAPPG